MLMPGAVSFGWVHVLSVVCGVLGQELATISNGRAEQTVDICVFNENPTDSNELYNLKRVRGALQIADEHVQAYILPPAVKAKFYYVDSGPDCYSVQGPIVGALDIVSRDVRCEVFIGPGCSSDVDALYSFSMFYKIPMMAVPAAGVEASGPTRPEYPLLIRMSYTFDDVCSTLIRVLQHYNFTHTTVFTDDTQAFYQELGESMVGTYRKYDPRLDASSRFKTFKTGNVVVNEETMRSMLVDANTTSRVFVVLANATFLRRFMLLAHDMRLTNGEYVYWAVGLFDSKYWGSFTWKTGAISDRLAQMAFRSVKLITMVQEQDPAYDVYAAQVRKMSQDRFNYSFGLFEAIDPITTGFYEAVILYGMVVRDLYRRGENVTNGTLVAEAMKNMSFVSPVNGLVQMDGSGDRDVDYAVKSFDDESGMFQTAMIYNFREGLQTVGQMSWPYRNSSPPDMPYCGFSDEAERCMLAAAVISPGMLALAIVLPAVFVIAMVAAVVSLFLRQKGQTFDPYWWRIPNDDLQIVGAAVSVHSKGSTKNDGETIATKSTLKTGSSMNSYYGSFFDNRAYYLGTVVAIREIMRVKIHPSNELVEDLKMVRNAVHDNIHKLIGISVTPVDNFCLFVVAELCNHGSLQDVLTHETIKLDWSFKNSIIRDIVMGMDYIHASPMVSHGDLTGYTLMVDSRFTVKVTDVGLWLLRDPANFIPPSSKDSQDRDYEPLLWRAPELLRARMSAKGTQKGDIYSFAIILQQIILRCEAYEIPNDDHPTEISKQEIILEVQKGTDPPLRPRVPRVACSNEVYALMEQCWSEYPLERPPFSRIKENLKKIIGKTGDNIVDHLLKRMEEYAGELELQVQEKTHQFMSEKQRSEQLLCQLLPKSVAEALTKGQSVDPEAYESVTIYFSDIVDFTTMSATGSPMDVVSLLNSLYTLFDTVIEKYDVYKVETIGDAYMVCSGLPVRNGNRHAKEIALLSISIRNDISSFVIPHRPLETLRVRIGCHSGPCVAGIVGLKMPRFCLFGDTVNTASRMESTSEPMKIQISEDTHDCLMNIGGFVMENRGPTNIKGKGIMNTYWLVAAM